MDRNPALRSIQLVSVDSIEELQIHLQRKSTYFTLLLAWDAPPFPEDELVDRVRPLVESGLVYFCSWGSRCEAVHDAVDHADIQRIEQPNSEQYCIMTTWHSKDSLSEACWYFKSLALPTEEPFISDFERFAVAIGNKRWAEEMERSFAAQVKIDNN